MVKNTLFFWEKPSPSFVCNFVFFKVNPQKKKLQKSFSLQKNVKRKDFEYKKQ